MTTSSSSHRIVRHAGWRLTFFILVLAGLAVALTGLFVMVRLPKQLDHGVLQPGPLLISAVAVVALIMTATMICLRFVEHRPATTIGLPNVWRRPTDPLLGLALGAIVPLLVAFVLRALGHASIVRASLTSGDILSATLPMLAATLLLSSWEEIAFRGYPLQLLNEIGGPWLGASVTGLAFGLAHSGNPGANVLGFINTAVNGALLGWVVIKSGNLWLACGYHAGWNLTASNVLGLRDSGVIAPGSLFNTTLSGPTWQSGGAYGFEASLITGVTEVALFAVILSFASRLPSVPAAQPYFAGNAPRVE